MADEASGTEMEVDTPVETPEKPEQTQTAKETDAEEGEVVETTAPPTNRRIFGKTVTAKPQGAKTFMAPTVEQIQGMFGAASLRPVQATPIRPPFQTPSSRLAKEAARKIQSSPIKPVEDGDTSDGYTTVGTKGKRGPKKNHMAGVSRAKLNRLAASGQIQRLQKDVDELNHESTTIATVTPGHQAGTGSGPESDENATGVSSNTTSSSSAAESTSAGELSSDSGVGTAAPARAPTQRPQLKRKN